MMDSIQAFGLDGAVHFLAKISLPDGTRAELQIPARWTVDQVKTFCFKKIPALQTLSKFDYQVGVNQNDLLTVEFARFVRSKRVFEENYLDNQPVFFGFYARAKPNDRNNSVTDSPPRRRTASVHAAVEVSQVAELAWNNVPTRRKLRKGSDSVVYGPFTAIPPPAGETNNVQTNVISTSKNAKSTQDSSLSSTPADQPRTSVPERASPSSTRSGSSSASPTPTPSSSSSTTTSKLSEPVSISALRFKDQLRSPEMIRKTSLPAAPVTKPSSVPLVHTQSAPDFSKKSNASSSKSPRDNTSPPTGRAKLNGTTSEEPKSNVTPSLPDETVSNANEQHKSSKTSTVNEREIQIQPIKPSTESLRLQEHLNKASENTFPPIVTKALEPFRNPKSAPASTTSTSTTSTTTSKNRKSSVKDPSSSSAPTSAFSSPSSSSSSLISKEPSSTPKERAVPPPRSTSSDNLSQSGSVVRSSSSSSSLAKLSDDPHAEGVITAGTVLNAISTFRKLEDSAPPKANLALKQSSSGDGLHVLIHSEPVSQPLASPDRRVLEKKSTSTDLRAAFHPPISASSSSSSINSNISSDRHPAVVLPPVAEPEPSSEPAAVAPVVDEPPPAPAPAPAPAPSKRSFDTPPQHRKSIFQEELTPEQLAELESSKNGRRRSSDTNRGDHSRSKSQNDAEVRRPSAHLILNTDITVVNGPVTSSSDASSVDDWLVDHLEKEQTALPDDAEEEDTQDGSSPRRKRKSFHLAKKFLPRKKDVVPPESVSPNNEHTSFTSRFKQNISFLPFQKSNMANSKKKFTSNLMISQIAEAEEPPMPMLKRSLSEPESIKDFVLAGIQPPHVSDLKAFASKSGQGHYDDQMVSYNSSHVPDRNADVHPVGWRPLAHLRQPPPVVHTPEEAAFSTLSISSCKGWVVEKPQAIDADDWRLSSLNATEATGNTWYKQHFHQQKDAKHYIGTSKDIGPFVVSVLADTRKSSAKSNVGTVYKALYRTQDGDDLVSFPASAIKMSVLRSKPSTKELLRVIDPRLNEADVIIQEIQDKMVESFSTEMVSIEQKQRVLSYKFGILYVKAGQEKEEEMFGNEHGSPAFNRFLETLGERVKLLDWKKYRAGLDTTRNTTGIESIYTTYENFEVMFHVSSLLPYKKSDAQQLERKRHIGNDIGVIVYREGESLQPYRPNTIESEFNHILAVVDLQGDPQHPDDKTDRYAVSVVAKTEVPSFRPPLPTGFVFKRDAELRDLLIKKMINGENACFQAPIFATKIRRTRFALFKNLFETFNTKV